MRTRTILAALCTGLAMQAHAVGRWTDATDLWWNAAESGWGVNVVQQNEVLFLTFFVYGPNRNPVWYSASSVSFAGTSDGTLVFQGDLHETHGPWLTDYFNPATVTYRRVGSVMFRMTSVGTATLVYSIDGWTVQKQLTRYTARVNEFAPAYLGTLAGTYSSCPSSLSNGYREETGLELVVMQASGTLAIRATGASATCTFGGAYEQAGRMGSMSGSYSCTNGTLGTFEAFEIESNPQMFSARMTTHTNNCDFSGRIGGLRRN